jgi:tRNA 2-thiouridine synthesizing protein E
MPDILKFIMNEGAEQNDPEGRFLDLQNWSEEKACLLAAEDDVQLTDQHWQVIHFLRKYYQENGESHHARELTEALEKHFSKELTRKDLYRLFPKGPVHQGSRIAGIPVPADSSDPSFGSVQ